MALKATVFVPITQVIKARIGISFVSALGMVLLASWQPRPAAV
jgi:hypothetical protein